MQTNRFTITYAYHFLSEALIIFLIGLPILHHKYQYVPYWSYLVVILVTTVVLMYFSKYVKHFTWYIFVAPILFGVFYLLEYPFIFALLFSLVLVWRLIDIQNVNKISRENLYIVTMLILTAVVSVLVQDSRVMVYPFLQFVILFIGYISSHVIVVDRKERKRLDWKLPTYFISGLSIGAVVLYVFFEPLRKLTVGLAQGTLTFLAGGMREVSDYLRVITVEDRGWPDQEPEEAKHGDGYWNELEEFNIIENMTGLLLFGVSIILVFVFVYFIFIAIKKIITRKPVQEVEAEKTFVSHSDLEENDGEQKEFFSKLFTKYRKRPKHPVRRLVYQLEKEAEKRNKGRKPFETIEHWLRRIGYPMELSIYQKVRYGNKEYSEQELNVLKEEIKQLKSNFEG